MYVFDSTLYNVCFTLRIIHCICVVHAQYIAQYSEHCKLDNSIRGAVRKKNRPNLGFCPNWLDPKANKVLVNFDKKLGLGET